MESGERGIHFGVKRHAESWLLHPDNGASNLSQFRQVDGQPRSAFQRNRAFTHHTFGGNIAHLHAVRAGLMSNSQISKLEYICTRFAASLDTSHHFYVPSVRKFAPFAGAILQSEWLEHFH